MQPVITTLALVLKELLSTMEGKIDGLHRVYDPALTYDTGTKLLRASHNYKGEKRKQFPLLLWNRSIFRYQEQMGKRGIHKIVDLEAMVDGVVPEYRAALGEFDFRFVFITPNMSVIENFEIMYFGKEGFHSIKEFSVDFPGLEGSLDYMTNWGDLEDVVVEGDQWQAKIISGSCKITGWFLTSRSPISLIEDTYFDVYNTTTEYLISEHEVNS